MEEKILKILLVEDDELDAELILYELKRFGFSLISKVVDTKSTYIESLESFNPDIILSDYSMPKFDGMTSLLTRNENCPFIPFIIVTGSVNEETAVVCIKAGASDYVLKDNLKRLGPAVKTALEQNEIQKDKQRLIEELKASEEKYRLITENINDLVWIMDLDLNSIFVSPSIQRTLGYTVEERATIQTSKIVTPESLERVVKTIKDTVHNIQSGKIKDKNHTVKIELEQIRKDGTKFWVESNVGAYYDKNGNIVGIQGVTRDISQRKKAEDELKKSEEKYRDIFENIQDVFYETSLDGKILEISPSVFNISKYTRDEMLAKNMNDIYAEPEIRIQLIKELTENGMVNDYEVTLKDKDSINKRCSLTSKIIFDKFQKPLKIVGSMRNIEERKKAEQLLIEKEERFRLMMENLPIPAGAYNISNNEIIFINPRFCNVFGYTIQEIRNLNDWFVLSFPDIKDREIVQVVWNKNITNILESTDINEKITELKVRCKNGNIKIVEISYTIDRNTVFMVFNDITDRKQLQTNLENEISTRTRDLAIMNDQLQLELYERKKQEEKLKYSENLNSTTINAINDYIFVVDQDLKIIMFNDAIKQYIRQNETFKKNVDTRITGKKIQEVFPEFEEDIIDKYKAVLENCNGFSENIKLNNNNKLIYFEIKVIPLVSDGIVSQIVTSIHDITKLKLVEEEVKLNLVREKELNMLKSRFISVVSHEYRTPLASIQSSIQLIERYKNKLGDEKTANLFSGIYETIRYSNLLLDDISLIGKDESGRLEINYSECNLEFICRQCIEDTIATYHENANINFKINPDLTNTLMEIDESILKHILNNILSNAVKYSEKNAPIGFDVDLKDKKIIFTIEDSGRGIPDTDLKHIFEPFHRSSNVESIKGTGLGLTIVKRCVDLHKGTIQLKSKLGTGTKVVIKIPYNKTV